MKPKDPIWITRAALVLIGYASIDTTIRAIARPSVSGAALAGIEWLVFALNIWTAGLPCGQRRIAIDRVDLFPGEAADVTITPIGSLYRIYPAPGREALGLRIGHRFRRVAGLDRSASAHLIVKRVEIPLDDRSNKVH